MENLRKAPLKKGGWGDLRVGNAYLLVAVAKSCYGDWQWGRQGEIN